MLLDFKVRNYRSFRDETTFSMEPTSSQRDLQETLLSDAAGGWNYHANSMAVIYGPNAAGKTNLISALESLRKIALRGHIRNGEPQSQGATAQFELIPNMQAAPDLPTGFDIAFVDDGMLVEYGVDVDLGGFLSQGYPRKVTRERLRVNGVVVFDRDADGVEWGDLDELSQKLAVPSDLTREEYALIVRTIGNRVAPDELLLANGFRSGVDPELAESVLRWIREKLIIIFQAEDASLPKADLTELEDDSTFQTNERIQAITRKIGLTARQLGFPVRDGEVVEEMYSLLEGSHTPGKTAMVPAKDFESRGTVRLAWLIRAAAAVLENGGVLVADELDASVHPAVMRAIINLFHDDSINTNHAQLVFTTHNPAYLDSSLCRRDEVRFVDRKDDATGSRQWSLADLRSDEASGKDYMGEYLKGTYGAIQDLDLQDMFDQVGAKPQS